jgi:hypothetical protein
VGKAVSSVGLGSWDVEFRNGKFIAMYRAGLAGENGKLSDIYFLKDDSRRATIDELSKIMPIRKPDLIKKNSNPFCLGATQ